MRKTDDRTGASLFFASPPSRPPPTPPLPDTRAHASFSSPHTSSHLESNLAKRVQRVPRAARVDAGAVGLDAHAGGVVQGALDGDQDLHSKLAVRGGRGRGGGEKKNTGPEGVIAFLFYVTKNLVPPPDRRTARAHG